MNNTTNNKTKAPRVISKKDYWIERANKSKKSGFVGPEALLKLMKQRGVQP